MKSKRNAIVILSICGVFLFFKYIAQLYPSLIKTVLFDKYHLTGVQLGVLASSYYYSYSVMQIVSGIVLDRFDVRMPAFFAIFIIAISLLGFVHTDSFFLMCVYRALMGVGCSFATTLYMKCAATWTSKRVFSVISPLLATATMLGAAVGAAPIAVLFEHMGWQHGLALVGFLGIGLAFLALMFVHTKQQVTSASHASFKDLKGVVTNKSNLWLLAYSGLTFSPVVILGGLWGVPFLELKFHQSASYSAMLISVMFIGHAIGSPIWALLSTRFNHQKFFMILANVLSFTCLSLIIFAPMSYHTAELLFFIFGFSVGCFMLSFNICRHVNAVMVMGFAVALINSGEGIVGSILEPGIGYILDLYHNAGHAVNTVSDYQVGLLILPICYIVSTLVIFKLPFVDQNTEVTLDAETLPAT